MGERDQLAAPATAVPGQVVAHQPRLSGAIDEAAVLTLEAPAPGGAWLQRPLKRGRCLVPRRAGWVHHDA